MAAGGSGGEFSNVWTLAEAASREPFHLGEFLAVVWENTSGFLLVSFLVSLLAVLVSWVYVSRAGPSDGPDHRTRTRPSEGRTAEVSSSAKSIHSTGSANPVGTASDDSSDSDSASSPPPPPPPPAEEEEEDRDSSGDRRGEVPDLVDMAHHLPARVKQAELRHIREKLQSDMTEEQRRREREVEQTQMAAILELMQQNSDKFGKPSLDDMQAQLKLYM